MHMYTRLNIHVLYLHGMCLVQTTFGIYPKYFFSKLTVCFVGLVALRRWKDWCTIWNARQRTKPRKGLRASWWSRERCVLLWFVCKDCKEKEREGERLIAKKWTIGGTDKEAMRVQEERWELSNAQNSHFLACVSQVVLKQVKDYVWAAFHTLCVFL